MMRWMKESKKRIATLMMTLLLAVAAVCFVSGNVYADTQTTVTSSQVGAEGQSYTETSDTDGSEGKNATTEESGQDGSAVSRQSGSEAWQQILQMFSKENFTRQGLPLILGLIILLLVAVIALSKKKKRPVPIATYFANYDQMYSKGKTYYDLCTEELLKSDKLRPQVSQLFMHGHLSALDQLRADVLKDFDSLHELSVRAEELRKNQKAQSVRREMMLLNDQLEKVVVGLMADLEKIKKENAALQTALKR